VPVRRRFAEVIPKLVNRKWEGDGDRCVQDALEDLRNTGQGLPALPINSEGDLLVYSNGTYDRVGVGTSGQVLTVVGSAPAWANLPPPPTVTLTDADIGQTILASQIFGG
jgi:hypothetical protein